MRDFAILILVFGSIPLTFLRPQIGILMWFWISLMNPHRLTWGYAYTLRVALVVGVVTILAWLFSRERKVPPSSAMLYFLAALTIWMSVTTLFAIVPDSATERWEEAIKILGMTFVAACIINSKESIIQTTWVVAMSLAFYGVKGGLFALVSGGSARVWGPPDSFIADNNALGLALIMTLPLLHFLSIQARSRWIRLGLIGTMGLTIIATLCTYSRGDFLALGIMLVAFWLKAKRRFLTGIAALAVLGVALAYLPSTWYDRMYSIEDYQQDDSAQGRIDAWMFAIRLAANHPLTGGGFDVVDDNKLFFQYVPTAGGVHAFHSIYFEMLGEHGYVGLFIFLCLILSSLLTAQGIIRAVRGRKDLEWAAQLAAAIQISIIGYCAAGTFLNLGIYDLFYALIALLAATKYVVARAKSATRIAPAGIGLPLPGRLSPGSVNPG